MPDVQVYGKLSRLSSQEQAELKVSCNTLLLKPVSTQKIIGMSLMPFVAVLQDVF